MITSSWRRAAPAALAALGLAGGAGAALAQAQHPGAGPMLKATLSGAAEVPGPGDPDGTGAAMLHVDAAKDQVCYELQVQGVEPITMVHVHMAPPTESGPPLLDLKPPGADGRSSGCVEAGPVLLKGLTDNPGAYYVNVHTATYKAGALRGQLGR